ncbi:MAG TPA: RNase H family protein, partial [Candidatus Nitrosotenuis sp.]|nr:RNase H family protein [Candidatus Nitrosotenuis sp.]
LLVWCDSQYTVRCATGRWRRHKNTDLWLAYQECADWLSPRLEKLELRWTRGHAGNPHNEAADRLALRAATADGTGQGTAAGSLHSPSGPCPAGPQVSGPGSPSPQAARPSPSGPHPAGAAEPRTGSQTPPSRGLHVPSPPLPASAERPDPGSPPPRSAHLCLPPEPCHAGTQDPTLGNQRAPSQGLSIPPPPGPRLASVPDSADYILTVLGACCGGQYLLATRGGRRRRVRVEHPECPLEQAEYLALAAGLRDLLGTLRAAGRAPADFTLAVRSCRQLLVEQLRGRFKVRAPGLRPRVDEALALLAAFGQVHLEWMPGRELRQALEGAA